MNMPIVVKTPHYSPSMGEIESRFECLYSEIESRARAMSRRYKDPEEARAEGLAFMWSDFRGAACRGRWLTRGAFGRSDP